MPRRSRATVASSWPRSTSAESDRRGGRRRLCDGSVCGPIHGAELAQCRRPRRRLSAPTVDPLRDGVGHAPVRFARIRRHAQDSMLTGRSDWVRSRYLDGSARSSRSARQPAIVVAVVALLERPLLLLPRSRMPRSRSGLQRSRSRGWDGDEAWVRPGDRGAPDPGGTGRGRRRRSPGGPVRPARGRCSRRGTLRAQPRRRSLKVGVTPGTEVGEALRPVLLMNPSSGAARWRGSAWSRRHVGGASSPSSLSSVTI